jgi:hypothetical protein
MPKAIKGTTGYDADNLFCARHILAAVDAHGGEGAGVVLWARLVLSKRALNARVPTGEPRLFQESAR